jgi:hypothetical protein
MERMMKLQDVLLKAMAKKITWWAAAEIMEISDRSGARTLLIAKREIKRRQNLEQNV